MAKKFDFKKIAMKATGAASGGVLSLASNKVLGNLDPKIRGIAKIVAGAILPELAPKSPFINDMGCGIIGAGAAELTETLVPALAGETVTGIGQDRGYVVDEEYELGNIGNENEDVIAEDPEKNVIGNIDDVEEF